MNYSKVIHEAWQLVNNTPKLKWLTFVPSLVAVLVFMLEVIWQLYMYFSEFGIIETHLSFQAIGRFMTYLLKHNLLLWTVLVIFFTLFFIYIVPAWLRGTLISAIHDRFKHPEKSISLRQKGVKSCSFFFRIFEFNAILSPFEFVPIMLFMATFYRYFHDSLFTLLVPFLIFHLIVSFFVQVFFSYTPYFIVTENAKLGESLKKSVVLTLLNFGNTVGIILLMFLVNLRVIINVIVILGVPMGLFIAFSYFTSSFAITFSILLGVAMTCFAAYLTAILEVFQTAVWERVFITIRQEQQRHESEN